jgi:hypothetical protein
MTLLPDISDIMEDVRDARAELTAMQEAVKQFLNQQRAACGAFSTT